MFGVRLIFFHTEETCTISLDTWKSLFAQLHAQIEEGASLTLSTTVEPDPQTLELLRKTVSAALAILIIITTPGVPREAIVEDSLTHLVSLPTARECLVRF